MTEPYISRSQAEAFLNAFAEAVKSPDEHPVLYQAWGVGGVGKTTLLDQVQKQHPTAKIARVYFGSTEGIDTPIDLMANLYAQLPAGDVWGDNFAELHQQFQQTEHQLKTLPMDGKQSVDLEQQNVVKRLLSYGLSAISRVTPLPDVSDADSEKAITTVMDTATLLKQHRATKRDPKLRQLMSAPLPKLTQAFIEGLRQRSHLIILMLDTYEKASSDHDNWIRQHLLGDQSLPSSQIRVVVAGRRCLKEQEAWRKLEQDRKLLFERQLKEFSPEETEEYLQQIGITQPEVVWQIYRVTKGLPYYLNWIRREREAGRPFDDFSRGNEEISRLLLQGLNDSQKQIVQFAACCREFDRDTIRHLLTTQSLDFKAAADPNLDCFDWLRQCDFVEYHQGCYRLDDVARDVFRQSLWYADRGKTFRQVCDTLAAYFEAEAGTEAAPDSPPPARYSNAEWRRCISDWLYYATFARRPNIQTQWLTYLLEARYLQQNEMVRVPLAAITAEAKADVKTHPLLDQPISSFLGEISPAVRYGWAVLEETPIDYEWNQIIYGLSKNDTDRAWQTCLRTGRIEVLSGLAKFAALFYKSKRCPDSERLEWLAKAKTQAEQIADPDYEEFSSGLFLWSLGIALYQLGRYEEAIESYEQALKHKPNSHEAWINRGMALDELGRYDKAIESYEQALKHKPNSHEAWYNRGVALDKFARYEEAIESYEQALKHKPDYHQAWYNRGIVLGELGRYDKAIESYEQALKHKPNSHEAWCNRGMALGELGRYDKAIESYEQALKHKPTATKPGTTEALH
jgi:tetratricopeptide (TPR) repeat protein